MSIVIGWLYGASMNIYGDRGNIIALTQRAKWRGIDAEVVSIGVGDPIVNVEIAHAPAIRQAVSPLKKRKP